MNRCGSKAGSASTTNMTRAAIFTSTSTTLTRALSRVPRHSSPATASETTTAGRFTRPPAAGPASRAEGIGRCAERITPPA